MRRWGIWDVDGGLGLRIRGRIEDIDAGCRIWDAGVGQDLGFRM